MRYCPTHQRALMPESYDPPQAQTVPAHWRAVNAELLMWARIAAVSFPKQAQIIEQDCDVCQRQEEPHEHGRGTDPV